MESINKNANLKIAPRYRLQWEDTQNSYVLLYPEGMIILNNSASEILRLCNGQHNIYAIINILNNKFSNANLDDDIQQFIEEVYKKGWIVLQ